MQSSALPGELSVQPSRTPGCCHSNESSHDNEHKTTRAVSSCCHHVSDEEEEEGEKSLHAQGAKSSCCHYEESEEPAHIQSHTHAHGGENSIKSHWVKGGLGLLWGLGVLILPFLPYAIPFVAMAAMAATTVALTLYLGKEAYASAVRRLRSKKSSKLGKDTLYALSTLTLVGLCVASFFVPGLPMMLECAPMIFGFWHLGEAIEGTLTKRIESNLKATDGISKKIRRKWSVKLNSYVDELVDINAIEEGDVVEIASKKKIPFDGRVASDKGEVQLYTANNTGTLIKPELFDKNKAISAGMIVHDDTALLLRVNRKFADSSLARLDKHIADQEYKKENKLKAESDKDPRAPSQILADTVLRYFIPGLLALAIISAIVIGVLFNPALAIQCAISVLVSACPCTLNMITPYAVKIGMKKAADNGITFASGRAMEMADDIKVVVFDLNGTLTKGVPEVKKSSVPVEYLAMVKAMEEKTEHAYAKAIVRFVNKELAEKNQTTASFVVDDFNTSCHAGISAMINGKLAVIGSRKIFNEKNIAITAPHNDPANGSIYFYYDGEIRGQIKARDQLRDDAKATVAALQARGKEVHICTGDAKPSALEYAKELGVQPRHVKADCAKGSRVDAKPTNEEVKPARSMDSKASGISLVPAIQDPLLDKVKYIESLQQNNQKVAMVGNGDNDSIAVVGCDLGIAIKCTANDALTFEKADAKIQGERLFPIVTAFDISKKMKNNIYQNLMVSLTYNSTITLVAAGVFIAIGFALNPVLGIALMVLESLIVLANVERFKRQQVEVAGSMGASEIVKKAELDSTQQISSLLANKSSSPVNTNDPSGINSYKKPCCGGRKEHAKTAPQGVEQPSMILATANRKTA